MRGPGCAAGEPSPSGGGGQRLDELVSEANDLISSHVASYHSIGQTRLKRLIDDAPAPGEIGLAACHEFQKRQILRDATPLGMQDAHGVRRAGSRRHLLDLPNSLATIAAVLLDDPRARRLQSPGERDAELGGTAVKVRVRAPAEMFRTRGLFCNA